MTTERQDPPTPRPAAPGLRRAGYLLGFAMGGFFDGILLHQVLQWHHLLSAVDSPAVADLRVQILADGLFHAAMYVIAVVGLVLLWRNRGLPAGPRPGRRLAGSLFVGFGAWHVLDGVLSHWVLGIHRIRMDAAHPLLWDLMWFAVFGVAAIATGLWLLRGPHGPPPPTGTLRRPVAAGLSVTVAICGVLAARPPDRATALVLFRPEVAAPQVFAAADAVAGTVVWGDATGTVWAVRLERGTQAFGLYAHGAIWVVPGVAGLGCLPWIRP